MRGLVVLTVLLGACRSPADPPTAPSPIDGNDRGPVTPALGAVARVEHAAKVKMPSHFADVLKVHNAIIEGSLPTARAAAARVVADQPSMMLEDWAPHMFVTRAAAQHASGAETIEKAASAAAELAASCGSCHLARGAHLQLEPASPPPIGDDAAASMRRHAWAFERLWEGLVLPSDERWLQGVDAFVELPPCDDGPSSERDAAAIHSAREVVRLLESDARAASSPQARTEVYARMLPTCSACHAAGC